MTKRIFITIALAATCMLSTSTDASLYRVDSSRSTGSVSGFGHSAGAFKDVTGWIAFQTENVHASEIRFSLPLDGLAVNVDPSVTYTGTQLLSSAPGAALTFKSSSVREGRDHKLTVKGTMTLGSVSREVTIPIQLLGWEAGTSGARKAGFGGEFKLDLSSFGVPTGLLGDKVNIKLRLLGLETSETQIPMEEGPSS
jgi:polyisoprenoid-binding protein YceI